MKSSHEASSQSKDQENHSNFDFSATNKTNIKCVIASDAPKKLDFLILVIETLQINATESLLLKAKNIGLSEDFSNRVHFWKLRTSNPFLSLIHISEPTRPY